MIITIEHTSGGEPAHCCSHKVQTPRSLNLKRQWGPGSACTERTRLCEACAKRIAYDLCTALRVDDIPKELRP